MEFELAEKILAIHPAGKFLTLIQQELDTVKTRLFGTELVAPFDVGVRISKVGKLGWNLVRRGIVRSRPARLGASVSLIQSATGILTF